MINNDYIQDTDEYKTDYHNYKTARNKENFEPYKDQNHYHIISENVLFPLNLSLNIDV